MQKNKTFFGIIEIIVFLVYNLIVFISSPNMTATFWVAYVFTVLAFGTLAYNLIFSNNNEDSVSNNFSLSIVNIAYLILQIIVGSILIVFSMISVKITVVLEVILFAVFLVISLFLIFGKSNGQKLDADAKDKRLFIKLLSNDIAVLLEKTSDAAILTRLEELNDAIDSSDPIGHTSLALVEQKISNKIATLSELVTINDTVKAGDTINEIEQMLDERNRKCKILK